MKYSDLRKQIRDSGEKLNKANSIVCKQIDEIETLNRLIDVQSNQIKCLQRDYEEEHKQRESLEKRIGVARRSRDKIHKKWLKQQIVSNRWKIGFAIETVVAISIVIFLGVKC